MVLQSSQKHNGQKTLASASAMPELELSCFKSRISGYNSTTAGETVGSVVTERTDCSETSGVSTGLVWPLQWQRRLQGSTLVHIANVLERKA